MGFNVLNYVLAKKNTGGSTAELESLKQQLAGLQRDLEVIQDADLINRVNDIEVLLNQDMTNLDEVKGKIEEIKTQISAKVAYRVVD